MQEVTNAIVGSKSQNGDISAITVAILEPKMLTKSNMLIYIINSGFVFVVCVSRTIFGNRKGAHVQIEGEKHGNGDPGLNMVCTQ